MIKDEVINEIKKHLGEYLEETGRNTKLPFTCVNPSHEDRHPSMSYDPKRNIIKCFSKGVCEFSTDLIGLYALDHNLDEKSDFKQIVEELAKHYNIPLNKEISNNYYGTKTSTYVKVENKEDFTSYYKKCKKDINKTDYLEKRGLSKELIEKYNIGYDVAKKMVILPISKTCYEGRSVEPNAYIKHFKPKGISNELFNLDYIKNSNYDSVIWVTEAIIDALSLEETKEDIKAVSLNSLNNSSQLVEELRKNKYKGAIMLALDTDNSGINESKKLQEEIEALGIKTFIFNSSNDKYNKTYKVKDLIEKYNYEEEENEAINWEIEKNGEEWGKNREDYLRFRILGNLQEDFKEELKKPINIKVDNLINKAYNKALENPKNIISLEMDYNEILNEDLTLCNKDINEYLLNDKDSLKGALDYIDEAVKTSLRNQAINTYEQENAFNYLDEFNKYILDEERTKPLSTGIDVIDEALEGGFYKKNLVILGAISSMGKTTLALQIADNIARQEEDVLIFSLEMSKEELIAKSLSRLSFLNTWQKSSTYLALTTKEIMRGKGVKTDIPNNKDRVQVYSEVLEEYKDKIAKHIYISECNETLELNVKMIEEKIKRHIAITGRKPFVIVDYLQIIKSEVKGTDTQIIANIVTDLKRIARNNDITLFLISAFNRNSYSKEADLSSFRDSSTIEYTSDVLLSLQPKVLDGQTGDTDGKSTNKSKVNQEQQKENRGLTLKVLKNRNGRITDVKGITFYAKYNYMSFKNANISSED